MSNSMTQFVETEHGRQRRAQRGIDKKDLLTAKRCGKKRRYHNRPNGHATAIYTHEGITYIVDEVTGDEVTCWAESVELTPIRTTANLQQEHNRAKDEIDKNKKCWTTNTVFVVDTSGSMRTSDVWGTKSRLGAVWLSLALDFVAHRLESGVSGPTDVISIVTLGEYPKVVIQEWPCTWVLCNKIVEIYNTKEITPCGHGPFMPALEIAKRLLYQNQFAKCVLSLFFLSDGVPSDRVLVGGSPEQVSARIAGHVEEMAKQYGPRLNFTAISIGDAGGSNTLEHMVEAAEDYGAIAEFASPSMDSSALANELTKFATTITATQYNMTCVATQGHSKVRRVNRESRKVASERISQVSSNRFWIYPAEQVQRLVYKEWFEGRAKKKRFERTPLHHPDAKYVALSKGSFGEGKERYAYRFFELAEDGSRIVGPPLVAKESRLILDENEQGGDADEAARKEFVRTFCSTQQLARRLSEEFNAKMNQTHCIHPNTPRVSFLDCSIYEINDPNLGRVSYLVEEKIDQTKWHKWNNNDGDVTGVTTTPRFVREREMVCSEPQPGGPKLDSLAEETEDEEDSLEKEYQASSFMKHQIRFSASEVAQAFSHFTYVASGRKRLVCDLQGVFDEEEKVLRFTDPVIFPIVAVSTETLTAERRVFSDSSKRTDPIMATSADS